MVRTYRSFTTHGKASDVRAYSGVDGSGGFNPPSSRFDVTQSDEAAVSAPQIQPPRDSSPSGSSDFSSVRVAHPTVLLDPTPPSPPGATARVSFTGGDFDDCLLIVDRLLPGSVSVQETTVSQTVSSLEQLLGRGANCDHGVLPQ